MMKPPEPQRGDVWLVNFVPQIGAEISKQRPAVVMNLDAIGRLPLRVIVPITDWKPHYANYVWFVPIPPTAANGLSKDSGADVFQVKSVSLNRFISKLGVLTESQIDEIASAIALTIGYRP